VARSESRGSFNCRSAARLFSKRARIEWDMRRGLSYMLDNAALCAAATAVAAGPFSTLLNKNRSNARRQHRQLRAAQCVYLSKVQWNKKKKHTKGSLAYFCCLPANWCAQCVWSRRGASGRWNSNNAKSKERGGLTHLVIMLCLRLTHTQGTSS